MFLARGYYYFAIKLGNFLKHQKEFDTTNFSAQVKQIRGYLGIIWGKTVSVTSLLVPIVFQLSYLLSSNEREGGSSAEEDMKAYEN